MPFSKFTSITIHRDMYNVSECHLWLRAFDHHPRWCGWCGFWDASATKAIWRHHSRSGVAYINCWPRSTIHRSRKYMQCGPVRQIIFRLIASFGIFSRRVCFPWARSCRYRFYLCVLRGRNFHSSHR